MSGPYDRYDRARSSRTRNVWPTVVPLVVLTAVAAAGYAAWVLGRRDDDQPKPEPEALPDLDYENADYGDNPPYGSLSRTNTQPLVPPSGPQSGTGQAVSTERPSTEHPSSAPPYGTNWGSRVAGALRRTSSPAAMVDSAGKSVAAGVAAAGAAMGSALAAIREGDQNAFADHETWTEEAVEKEKLQGARPASKRRKTVAVVLSAEGLSYTGGQDAFVEQYSILSHIPRQTDFSQTSIYVLVYSPGLKYSAADPTSNHPPPSISSSYSNIGPDQSETPLEGGRINAPDPTMVPHGFESVRAHAEVLVENRHMVLPFSTPLGHTHLLRSLGPDLDVIYLQESLAGSGGSIVSQLQTWFRHDIVLVVGAERGHAGLADSESEMEKPAGETVWWQRPERVGRGRGVVVVDSMRVADDWCRRVLGQN